jgi:hypothetical protein
MRRRPCLGSTSAASRSNHRDSWRPFQWDISTYFPRTRPPPRTSRYTLRPPSRSHNPEPCPDNRLHLLRRRLPPPPSLGSTEVQSRRTPSLPGSSTGPRRTSAWRSRIRIRRRPCLGSTSASSRRNRRDFRRPFLWDTSTYCPRTVAPRTSRHTLRPRSRQNTADRCPGNRRHCSSLRLVRKYRLRRRRRVPWKTRSRQQPSRDRSPRAPDSLGSRGLPTIVRRVACGTVYRICIFWSARAVRRVLELPLLLLDGLARPARVYYNSAKWVIRSPFGFQMIWQRGCRRPPRARACRRATWFARNWNRPGQGNRYDPSCDSREW